MYISRLLTTSYFKRDANSFDFVEIYKMRQRFKHYQIKSLPFWLEKQKKANLPNIENAPVTDITKLNVK